MRSVVGGTQRIGAGPADVDQRIIGHLVGERQAEGVGKAWDCRKQAKDNQILGDFRQLHASPYSAGGWGQSSPPSSNGASGLFANAKSRKNSAQYIVRRDVSEHLAKGIERFAQFHRNDFGWSI